MGERSKLTTLCYIEKDDSYLMLHRVSKKNDENKDKWIGIGGHFEEGESPEDCLLREAKEETGLTLTSWKFRGIVTFVSDVWGTEYMCLYTADGYTGEMISCNEGVLEWIKKEDLLKLNLPLSPRRALAISPTAATSSPRRRTSRALRSWRSA